ncbi:MAG: sensor histidine kinase [Acidobacteriota bacterium]
MKRITGLLLLLLVAINGVAIWGIISARQSTEETVRQDLLLQTVAHARTLEAALASRRSDFVFLSQSPPLANAEAALSSDNPMERRWRRLDMEGTLLLFMAAHPEVEQILLRDGEDRAFVVAGRRGGAAMLLSVEEQDQWKPSGEDFLKGSWALGAPEARQGRLEAWLNAGELLTLTAPALASKLHLRQGTNGAPQGSILQGSRELLVTAAVEGEGWDPPLPWTLVRREDRSGLIDSIAQLADRYWMAVSLNVASMGLALLMGLLAFQQVRRRAVLEAENSQQAKIRELERQVMHSERLASVGRLAAGVAHEINNPLEGMANYLNLLNEDIRERRYEDALQMTDKVQFGLRRAAGIVRQVLSFSDPGQAPKIPVKLAEVLSETVHFIDSNPCFGEVSVRLAGAREAEVLGNPVTLGQLFLNLLLNACEAQGGAGLVEINVEIQGQNVVVTVADRGPGIAEENLSRIFDPFFSTRGSTGLGLSVCHGIVSQHGGRIEANNRPGGGAAFSVFLPVHHIEEQRLAGNQ